jgi:hypothetical protein
MTRSLIRFVRQDLPAIEFDIAFPQLAVNLQKSRQRCIAALNYFEARKKNPAIF